MAWKQVPKGQTVVCEQCRMPPGSPPSNDQDPVTALRLERGVQDAWQCTAPHCNERLCLTCGKMKFYCCNRWLSCLSVSSEWKDARKDAYSAIARTTTKLLLERWQEGAEDEQDKHLGKQVVAKEEHGRPMDPSLISIVYTSLPSSSSPSSSEAQSPTLGPVREASRQAPTSGPVCEQGEQHSPDSLLERAKALTARGASKHPDLCAFAGPLAPISQRSASSQPATKSSPKSRRHSARGHRAASSSRSCERGGNLAALLSPGSVATPIACTGKARQGSTDNPLSDQGSLEEEVEAQIKHSPTPRRPPLPSLELLAAEPQRRIARLQLELPRSPKEPKELKSCLVRYDLAQPRPAKHSRHVSFEPDVHFKLLD